MTLKQFISKIGGMTDKNMKVVIRNATRIMDEDVLRYIKDKVQDKGYMKDYNELEVSFFNIVDDTLIIQMTPKK